MLPAWKHSFGEVFLWKGGDLTVVYRGLTFEEVETYNEIIKYDQDQGEDLVLRNVILYPKDILLDSFPAIGIQKLLETVNKSSGMSDADAFQEHLEKGRQYAQSIEGFGVAFISHAFSINPEEVRRMTLPILAKYIAMAETVLGKNFEFKTAKVKNRNGIKPTREQLIQSRLQMERQRRDPEWKQTNQGLQKTTSTNANSINPQSFDFAKDNRELQDMGFGEYSSDE